MINVLIMLSTYNGEKYLRKQLESIWQQDTTECNISMIVRDDGSRDNTLKILDEYKDKLNITVLNDGISLGPAYSFWKLLKEAPVADYYAFVDQDDMWDKEKLSSAIEIISGEKKRALWFSNCRLISENDDVISDKLHKDSPILNIPSQLICGSAQGCSMVLNKEAIFYLKSLSLKHIPMHDLVAMIYVLGTGSVFYDEIPRFSYRVHTNNVVAKAGKSFWQRKLTTYHNWFDKKNRCSTIRLAQDVLENCNEISEEYKRYLELLVKSKSSIICRIKLICHPLTKARSKAALRSFRIRALLGIV